MKKRLRKKLHRGEFQELGFFLKVKYAEMPDEEFDRFIDSVIDKIGSLGLECGGRFDVNELELFVTTGLGYSILKLRLNCPPEIAILDLIPPPGNPNRI